MLLLEFLAVGILTLPSAIITAVLAAILFFGQAGRGEHGTKRGAADRNQTPVEQIVATEVLAEDPQDALFKKISYQMDVEHLYLQPGLSINELTTLCGSNRTYVSNCINNVTGQSFSDFINSYRIHYAQVLMSLRDGELTMTKVAEMSGYSNDASFIRNFKKFSGCTPSEWLANQS